MIALVILALVAVAAGQPVASGPEQGPNISGIHVVRWFTGGGGLCEPWMTIADCSYRRRLMTHIKNDLQNCSAPLTPNLFSVSHRGSAQIYPEHTTEGYNSAIAQGAGYIECDTSVSKDLQLVCRHSTCDMASTTNVLSIPALAAKCTIPNKKCCTYDFTLAEYSTLCGVSYSSSGPWLQAYSWNASAPGVCLAHPANLKDMAAQVIAAGRNVIPEQKNCDLLCQAKVAAYAPNNITADKVVAAISDKMVATLQAATGGDASRSILQTFELPVALYISSKYGKSQAVTFLYEFHGQDMTTTQNDYYRGYYPANYTTINGSPSPALGSPGCSWCVNGTSPNGWYDVLAAGAAGVVYASPSTSDAVRPQGALMVASEWAIRVAAAGMKLITWTLERSQAVYATSPAPPNAWPSSAYTVQDSVGWAYEQHTGVSALDYEDMLFMLYALRFDVPNSVGVFSDFPGSTTVFANCVSKMDTRMPVAWNATWAVPTNQVAPLGVPAPVVALRTSPNKNLLLDGVALWRMFAGGGGLCGVAGGDESFYDYDLLPPALIDWGNNQSGVVVAVDTNKPFPCSSTTSPLDCAYRRKLMNHIKNSMATCATAPMAASNFSVSHRGSAMTYPEHSLEGYQAAVAFGANFIECDTSITKDLGLVCRHSTCDLHTTTNILVTPLAVKCSVPFKPAVVNASTGALVSASSVSCCTYDLTLAEYSTLCAINDLGSGWAYATTPSDYYAVGPSGQRSSFYDYPRYCATPGTLATMAPIVVGAKRNLIPEQKNCDLLCQAKVAAYAPNNITADKVVQRQTDLMVSLLDTFTNSNAGNAGFGTTLAAKMATTVSAGASNAAMATPIYVIQTFEIGVALYLAKTYPRVVICFLYQKNGANLSPTQADTYLGSYPAGYTTINGAPTAAIGGPCTWCVNGSSPGGWADVYTAAAAGVAVGGISIADLVVPQGSLMVASEQAIKVAALGMYYTPWTLERSNGAFATGGNLAQSAQPAGTIGVASGNANQFSASVGGYYLNHAGVSALDYEDMLFMMYALKWDVPNMIGVFSDYPGTTTAFGNCVPKLDAKFPVAWNATWAQPHAFDLRSSPVVDVGRVGGWAATGGAGAAVVTASSQPLAPFVVTFNLTALIPAGSTAWYTLFSASGLTVSFNPGAGSRAPGLNTSSILVVSNQNGNASNCNSAVFFDASPTVNGAPYSPVTGRRLHQAAQVGSITSGVPTSITITVSAAGVPGVPTDGAGNPFMVIPYPAAPGYVSHCAPLSMPAGTAFAVGGASFPGVVTFVSMSA